MYDQPTQQTKALANEIAKELDNNQLAQLAEILDNRPDAFLEAINEIAAVRIPEIFGDSDTLKEN